MKPMSDSLTRLSVLVLHDDPSSVRSLCAHLSSANVETVSDLASAKSMLANQAADLALVRWRLVGSERNPEAADAFFEWMEKHSPKASLVMTARVEELSTAAVVLAAARARKVLFEPWTPRDVNALLVEATRVADLEQENHRLRRDLDQANDRLHGFATDLDALVADRTRAMEQCNRELQAAKADLEDRTFELEQKSKMLEKLASTDPLTQIPNRRAMDRVAEREVRRRTRYPSALTLGIVDVDHFKNINDRYLLKGGDRVLCELAQVLKASLRDVDFVGRIGGEEFMFVAPNTDMEGAQALGERIRSAVENTVITYGTHAIRIHVSIGLAVAEEGVEADYEALGLLASAALSEAKKTGRNRCVFYTVSRHLADPAFRAALESAGSCAAESRPS